MDLRRIDCAVAEKVMGFALWLNDEDDFDPDTNAISPRSEPPVLGIRVLVGAAGNPCPYDQWHPLPHYTTSWDAAGQVVERMRERGIYMSAGALEHIWWVDWGGVRTYAETFPLAIALAALKAIGVEIPEAV